VRRPAGSNTDGHKRELVSDEPSVTGPPGVQLAPATTDDADAVADLWVALAADQRRHGSTLLAAANRTAVREWAASRAVTGELFVARDRGETDGTAALLGFVGFTLEHEGYDRDCTRGVVSNLYVVPERRGEGVGSALLHAAEQALSSSGADAVVLEALASNDRARAFYAEHGYDLHRVELRKSVGATNETPDDGDGS
jgi:ribosomal protein S18 acetylase RimI-like enzyme